MEFLINFGTKCEILSYYKVNKVLLQKFYHKTLLWQNWTFDYKINGLDKRRQYRCLETFRYCKLTTSNRIYGTCSKKLCGSCFENISWMGTCIKFWNGFYKNDCLRREVGAGTRWMFYIGKFIYSASLLPTMLIFLVNPVQGLFETHNSGLFSSVLCLQKLLLKY